MYSKTIDTQLSKLDVRQQHSLDIHGFLHIEQAIDAQMVKSLTDACEELMHIEGEDGGQEVHTEAGTLRLSNLINKHSIFRIMLNHPEVLAAISHVLNNDFKISSCNARFAKPGHGHQALHTDGQFPEHDNKHSSNGLAQKFYVCNSLWVLEDIGPHNGATRVVPGTHRSLATPNEIMTDPRKQHPAEITISAKAGDVIVFNSHLWHGGTHNNSNELRKCIHGYFTRRDLPQQTDQQQWLSKACIAALSDWERYICDVA